MKIFGTDDYFNLRAIHSSSFRLRRIQNIGMKLFQSDKPLLWGELDLPVLGMTADWYGLPLDPPLGFVIAVDASSLWFVATRAAPANCRRGAMPGAFMEGLWEGDVAELFLADPAEGRYLEFNLAPNGSWWAAKFTAPRVRAGWQPNFQSTVTSYSEEISGSGWCAALRVPLDFLRREIGFGARTTANATAILNSPQQTFHSATKLLGEKPDFHQPGAYPLLKASIL